MRIQIASRYVPVESRSGPFTYLLDLMHHLQSLGGEIELIVLDQWCQEGDIPQRVREVANVLIIPQSLSVDVERLSEKTPVIKSLLRLFYRRLPAPVLHPFRKIFYTLRGKQLPGHHKHDAPATLEEITFVTERLQDFQPDVIVANHTCLGNIFAQIENQAVLKTILTHQIESKKSNDFQQLGLQSRDSEWEESQEIDLLQSADVLLAIQQDDAALLRKMVPNTEVICVPMSAVYHEHKPSEQIPGRCLFVGSDIEHNVYGLQWFLHKVWPLVLKICPASELHVCGEVGAKIAGHYPNVRLLGRVDDIAQEYAEAELCIIPLIAGSGLKIKLVEALSHGRACVSTSIGIQGVRELDGKAVLVEDRPEDFAGAVTRILQEPMLRRALEEEARHYVTENLNAERIYRPLLERIVLHSKLREASYRLT